MQKEIAQHPSAPPTDSVRSAESAVALEPSSPEHAHDLLVGDVTKDSLPPLPRDPGFYGIALTQFFGAFNDNVFKQILLLLAVPVAVVGSAEDSDRQGLALFIFALPFLLFSGIAGYISERQSKRTVIVLTKVAEIFVMLVGLVVLLSYWLTGVAPESLTGLAGLFAVLFLMGAQSAFFGPGKFGILPETLRGRDLARANGIVMMSTFLAIIFGTALAGPLNDFFNKRLGQLWLASFVCVLIAVIGTVTSLFIRRTRPASPNLPFHFGALTIPGDVWQLLKRDRPLFWALLVSCMFWLVGGLVHPTVNKLGKTQLLVGHELADSWTSALAAAVGVGIAVGCIMAGLVSRGQADFRLVRWGCWGIVGFLVLLSIPGLSDQGPVAARPNLLGYWGSMVTLVLLGVCTGFFIVPLQVFLQSRPPDGMKGRTIATMNLTNWIAILASAICYLGVVSLLGVLHWPASGMFAFTALLMLPVALFYRPKTETETKEC